jgi:hypothetical protein
MAHRCTRGHAALNRSTFAKPPAPPGVFDISIVRHLFVLIPHSEFVFRRFNPIYSQFV